MSSPTIGLVIVANVLDQGSSSYVPVQNFIDLYEDNVERITILGPSEVDINRDGVDVVTVPRISRETTIGQILDYTWYQIRLAAALLRARNRYKAMFFHVGGTALLLPILVCRVVNITTNVFVLGLPSRSYYETHGPGVGSAVVVRLLTTLEWLTCRIADRILVLSDGMVSPGDGRIATAERITANLNYINCERFTKEQPLNDRPYDIIYAGRFSSEKGTIKLARALTQLIKSQPGMRVCLVGDGLLCEDMKRILREGGVYDQVDFPGWVNHDEMPSYYADARLLVLPSESEGVPTAMLEAMACGTVPVATPVGGVPDIIVDGETGFLLPDNDPATITDFLNKVLTDEDLKPVSNQAREYIRCNHSYDAIVEQFQSLLTADQ